MKTNVRFILLLCLCLLSSYSNSQNLHFKWNLKYFDRLILSGTAISSTHVSHSEITKECYWQHVLTKFFSGISGDHFVNYDLVSSTHIAFNQFDSASNLLAYFHESAYFHGLLGNGFQDLQHIFRTRYTLRGQTTTITRNIVQLLYCMFCFPCFLRSETINQDIPEQEARIRALEAATPNHLPEHVSIDSRSITHIALTDNIRRLLSSSTEAVDDDIYIFDLFLSNPETQKLIKTHLNSETHKRHEFIIIPGLFNTARLAEIVVKEQSSENDSEVEGDDDLKPTNFLTLIFRGGPVVRYHLKKLPTNDIQVLAVSVSSDSYILSFVIDNYDALANQPMTTYYSSEEPLFFAEPCHCRGACNCANSRNKDTDESDYQNDNMNENMSDSITDSVFFTLEQSK